ncbi:hypothetical protein Zmor_025928 [Zophobas morio]|uniref:ATP-dependent DNA helicase n=1 Tax=Zophobas morio TaxID=2755281 RepID=A0AA38HT44_9CUCU|nr:hypothetical protein Zmor_025928 [Zophobas morio]
MDLSDIDDDILDQFMDSFTEECQKEVKPELSKLEIKKDPGPEHIQVLLNYFGHQNFRPMQWEIISAIIYNRRDVCAVMSTGYGKSLCFQFPSTFLSGITLVISPLIALMEDQVLSLEVSNIPACLLGTAQKKQKAVVEDIFKNKYSLVYLTPEFCTGDYGADLLKKMSTELSVVLIAIDEAHCISSWGHDFRHQYRQLGTLRTIFAEVPIIAVTATATSRVRQDIITNLKLRNPLHICTGFDRPNIYFEVNMKSSGGVFKDLNKFMSYEGATWKFSGSTIIYCITRKETEELATILKGSGIKCLPYHAGLSIDTREETHRLFVKDKVDVIVATIAFGMGIDKPDIRNVIHYGCSKSIESYYQEVGRAGRDGLPAHCATFYANGDFRILRCLNSTSSGSLEQKEASLKKIEEYFMTRKCRRRFILEHFEDKVDHLDKPRKTCCDICTKILCDARTDCEKYEGIDENGCYDFTKDAKTFLKAVSVFNSAKFGLGIYILFLRGSNSSKLHERERKHEFFGSGKNRSEAWWQAIAKLLVQEKYLLEKTEKTSMGFTYVAISLSDKGRGMISSDEKLVIPPTSTIVKLLKPKSNPQKTSSVWISSTQKPTIAPSTSKKPVPETTETQAEIDKRMALYRKLLEQRGEIASQLDCMPYMVASNAALMTMSKLRPATLPELRSLNLDGFTEAKINKFGDIFLEVITGTSRQVSSGRKLSIKEILGRNPLPEVSMGLTAQVSCTMIESGLTVGEIAEKRSVTKGTIVSHLLLGIKFGYPIKMAELGVTEENRDVIVKVYRKFCMTGFTPVKLTPLKEQCPPEITFDDIRTVLAYLQVRCHLEKLNIPYQEFEDFQYNEVDSEGCSDKDWVVKSEIKDFPQTQPEVTESPAKKIKTEFDVSDYDDILGSPPKSPAPNKCDEGNTKPTSEEPTQTTIVNRNVKSKKKVLPPWFTIRKH